jgi:hypothetical protein
LVLTERVVFKARLQRGCRVSVPRLVRWRYKLESDQVLKITVSVIGDFSEQWEEFLGRMTKDGRITIPKLIVQLLKQENETQTLDNAIIEITLEPAETTTKEEDEEGEQSE